MIEHCDSFDEANIENSLILDETSISTREINTSFINVKQRYKDDTVSPSIILNGMMMKNLSTLGEEMR